MNDLIGISSHVLLKYFFSKMLLLRDLEDFINFNYAQFPMPYAQFKKVILNTNVVFSTHFTLFFLGNDSIISGSKSQFRCKISLR